MAQDTTAKKSNALSALVAAAKELKTVRDALKSLAEEFANDPTIAGIQNADCLGANSHLTRTIVLNMTQVVQPALETAIAAHLANLLAMLPS